MPSSHSFLAGAAILAGAALLARRRARPARGLDGMVDRWWEPPRPPAPKVCYRSKSAALREFVEANRGIIENYGGITQKESPAEFDAINHKYGLRGKAAVRSIAQALWAAMPPGRPYCLDAIDLDALNDTSPAREANDEFRLPEHVFVMRELAKEEEYHQRQLMAE